ncbi:MAG TPA: MerR family transcriptional regulator [Candidatus Gallibacteroides avistercoris]|uniref:MerR family transcriptional regulator n=1 Tax=Candidatus Gallibacteroides avistercoris TaxID=2840833 RepID=A0A9D1M7H2_9BACT|nr:MerR family transcriptional regulator [Candidatus Gallibacteroides avistercoris]
MGRDENKLYYTIGEVAEMFQVNESLLRFWEKEFDILSPRKSDRGTRRYSREDVDHVALIYHLVKEKKLTLAGARKQLKDNKEGVKRTHEVIARLMSIREELTAIRDEL